MPFPLTFPISFGGTETPYEVAGTLINLAAAELGLSPTMVEDPYASTDPVYFQLRAFLRSLGQELWMLRYWTHLTWVEEFTTTANVGAYPLPENFGRIIRDTGWCLSQTRGMGVLSPEAYREMRSRNVTPGVSVSFRIQQQQFHLVTEDDTPADQDIVYEYISRFWVQSEDEDAPDKEVPDAASDVIWFPPLLIVTGLKAKFKREKSMPGAIDAQNDFERIRDLTLEVDSVPFSVRLGGLGVMPHRIDETNLPETIG